MKRVAVILDNIYLVELESRTKKIILFEIDEEVIMAIDEDVVSLSDINYLCLWLLAKRAERVYCKGMSEGGKEVLEKAGIKVCPLEDIREHPILKALLLKEGESEENS